MKTEECPMMYARKINFHWNYLLYLKSKACTFTEDNENMKKALDKREKSQSGHKKGPVAVISSTMRR